VARGWFALAAFVVVLTLPAVGQAANFQVNTTSDGADPAPCLAAAAGCTVRGAVLAANSSDGADTIHIPAGTYVSTITGGSEEFAATGDLDIRGDVTITGDSSAQTILNTNNNDRGFDVKSGSVAMSALTIEHGFQADPDCAGGQGVPERWDVEPQPRGHHQQHPQLRRRRRDPEPSRRNAHGH